MMLKKHSPLKSKGRQRKRMLWSCGVLVALLFVLFSFSERLTSPNTPRLPRNTDTRMSIPGVLFTYLTYILDLRRILFSKILASSSDGKRSPVYHAPSSATKLAVQGGLYKDGLDTFIRPDETYVTFAQYLDCLAARLRVDYRRQREEVLTAEEEQVSFPYVLSMATVELGDIKTLMCNLTVPIRRMTYVVNSDVSAAVHFFRDVERVFRFTTRLRVHWPGYNMGFSGAVNYGMRDALRYSFDEVPFFFVLNNDIRFPYVETLPASLPEFRRVTRQDKAVLAGLLEEVAKEPSEHTPLNRRHPLLRSSDNSTLLVTSTALPDRIRYMPYEKRKVCFRKYYGALFFDDKNDTAAFGMSRLAMETVGFMDENIYPAYYEDTDWRYRQHALGFQTFHLEGRAFLIHYSNVVFTSRQSCDICRKNPVHEERSLLGQVSFEYLKHSPNYFYMKQKHGEYLLWGKITTYPYYEFPIDAWVFDTQRRRGIQSALQVIRAHLLDELRSGRKKERTGYFLDWLPFWERCQIAARCTGTCFNHLLFSFQKNGKLLGYD
ncbi:galactofuranosyltransferase [Strigomonas culicis]|uniref:Galactofuranosyltransferase n=1 Tax=Strigomonas culicis TaxID=28005 RepID=S9TRT8_9TRYP|nr:galactofuranosyltransferase [Strigomonas culicis]|eukprot:EPY19208.1 galactofuranosyltransferase [Strigomonas culicis]